MTKVELFSNDLIDVSSYFKALGHPARLAILKYLAETKICMTGDITNELPLSRTTVNQHLKELKDLNLIRGDIEGVKVNYCLDYNNIGKMVTIINDFFKSINSISDCESKN